MNAEKVLSVLALEIERALNNEYEIRRRSNVDIMSAMLLKPYELARLVQSQLDEFADNPEQIPQRVEGETVKWYTLQKRSILSAPSIQQIVECVLEYESLSEYDRQ